MGAAKIGGATAALPLQRVARRAGAWECDTMGVLLASIPNRAML
jgi:hypothetical protein